MEELTNEGAFFRNFTVLQQKADSLHSLRRPLRNKPNNRSRVDSGHSARLSKLFFIILLQVLANMTGLPVFPIVQWVRQAVLVNNGSKSDQNNAGLASDFFYRLNRIEWNHCLFDSFCHCGLINFLKRYLLSDFIASVY